MIDYEYDAQNQLTKETYYDGSGTGGANVFRSYAYAYDTAGNILSETKTENGQTTTKTYEYGDADWLDLLTGVSVTSENGNTVSGTITYDASGNPLSYFNGANYTMTWRNGKELNTLTTNGKTTGYEYDVDGLRTRKTNSDGSYSTYDWLGRLLLAEQRYDKNGSCTYTLRFSYDENDSPIGIAIKSGSATTFTPYYYAKNVQGDVIGLYQWNYSSTSTPTSTKVATYDYDPWGNFLGAYNASGSKITAATNAALLNPIRYRGYYYDSESGFYYLQSRYYDPQISRFINADDYSSTSDGYLGYNMFAYCLNNPVNRYDNNGNWSLSNWAKKAIAVAVTAVAVVAATAVTVATCGAGSVAGVAMITATASMAARATEVTVLQIRKGKSEGKTTGQVLKDSLESIYDNGKKVIGWSPYTKTASIATNHYLSANIARAFGGKQTLTATLKSTGGKFVPYAFAALAWGRTLVSTFAKDPVARAEQRGYSLK